MKTSDHPLLVVSHHLSVSSVSLYASKPDDHKGNDPRYAVIRGSILLLLDSSLDVSRREGSAHVMTADGKIGYIDAIGFLNRIS